MDNGWNPNDEPAIFDKIKMKHVLFFLAFWAIALIVMAVIAMA